MATIIDVFFNRRLLAALALMLLTSALAIAQNTVRRPNIVLLLADDQGWGDLGCYEHPVLKTPALDRLAREGCRFTSFYSSAPVCSPSRAGLLTGRIHNRFGMDHIINAEDPTIPVFHHLPPEEPTLPRLLRDQAGYATYHVGKWHLSFIGHDNEPTFADYGFDQWVLLAAGRYSSYVDSSWTRNGERFTTEGRWSADVYVEQATDFLDQHLARNPDQPFFLNLWSFAPHIEVDCSDEYKAMYPDRTKEEQLYFGAISQMDAAYGRLLDYLDAKGLRDNTIVIFTSDNGCTSPILSWVERSRGRAPLRGSKHNLGDAGIKVPGIVRWPGETEPGSVSHVPVSTLDLLPSLAAAAGVPLPAEWTFDGGDMRPAFRQQPVQRPHPLYWQFYTVSLMDQEKPGHQTLPLAMRDGSWKLMCDPDFGSLELYNLDTDPSEKWNMIDLYPEIAAPILERLQALHAEVNGPYARQAHNTTPSMLDQAPAGAPIGAHPLALKHSTQENN